MVSTCGLWNTRSLFWKDYAESIIWKSCLFFSQAYLSLLLVLLFINWKLHWSGDYALNHVWAVVALLLRKAAAIKLLVNLSIDTLHILLQKKNKLNFNLLGTQLNTWPLHPARDLSLWGTFQRWIVPLLCRGLFMFLKESLSGEGSGVSDGFLAAVVVSLALESQIIILCSC